MNTDDELRAQLVRERARRSQTMRAGEVLTELRPAMRSAKRRRLAVTAAAATMSLGGLVAAAQIMRTAPDNSIRSSSIAQLTESSISVPDVIPSSTQIEAVDVDPVGGIAPSSSSPRRDEIPTTIASDPDFGAVPAPAPSTSAPPRGDTGGASQPVTVTSTVPAPAPTPAAVPAPSSTIAGQPSPSTTGPPATTAPASGVPERFDSPCGYAWVIRSADSVELTEVVALPGYQYRLEDPDHHGITIQFTGTGEDCELKIPTVGGEADS